MKILPLDIDLETKAVLKKVAGARAALAEMKVHQGIKKIKGND